MALSSPILLLGHPKLRETAQAIADVTHPSTQALIQRLLNIVQEASGMGLAAPQIGESVRALVMTSKPNARYPHAPQMPPTVLLNPTLVWQTDEQEKGWEGCLSVPHLRGLVSRATAVKVSYEDEQGQLQHAHFQGFLARVFQHEYDHLEGILFIDRVESSRELMAEAEWQIRHGLKKT
ncbi:MAG: peptide deformylase [bacterium]